MALENKEEKEEEQEQEKEVNESYSYDELYDTFESLLDEYKKLWLKI